MSKKNRGNEPAKGSLAAQLKNLGMLSPATAREVERDRRKAAKKDQKAQGPTEAEQRRAEFERLQAAKAIENRERSQTEKKTHDRRRWREVVGANNVGGGGNRRFFYVDRAGSIPFVEAPDGVLRDLQRGEAAIVESHGAIPDEVAIVGGRVAIDELWRLDSSSVRYWNGTEPARRIPEEMDATGA